MLVGVLIFQYTRQIYFNLTFFFGVGLGAENMLLAKKVPSGTQHFLFGRWGFMREKEKRPLLCLLCAHPIEGTSQMFPFHPPTTRLGRGGGIINKLGSRGSERPGGLHTVTADCGEGSCAPATNSVVLITACFSQQENRFGKRCES